MEKMEEKDGICPENMENLVEQAREAFRDLCSKYEAQGLLLRSVRFRRDEHTDELLSINLSYTEKEEGL